MTEHEENARATHIHRKIAAPCETIFQAFSNPEHLARWWGPNGFTNTFHEFDFRPGGMWRFIMHGPDGRDYTNESRFVEIVPNEKIVIEHLSLPHFFLTVTLQAVDGATLVGWRGVFDTVETFQKVMRYAGTANEENMDRLTAEVMSITK